MSDKQLQQQRNDKKHRKLVRSPEKLSPCDLEPSFNPSFLSTSTNIFGAIQSNNRSSPTKAYHDQFQSHNQQVWLNTNLPANLDHSIECSTSLPPSSSTPAIALYRKPSITIKYSKDGERNSETSYDHQPSLDHHQLISKSIDSNYPFSETISTKEHVDQMSNNFLINFNSVPESYSQNNTNFSLSKQQQQQQKLQHQQLDQKSKNVSLISFNEELNSSRVTATHDNYQEQIFAYSPTSQALNLNLNNQTANDYSKVAESQIVFNSNNPFLNDAFDAITSQKENVNFFNIDDTHESELLLFAEESSRVAGEIMEEQLLKNKREKFSTASTMKICLVVSPPTNKLFQVSIT